MAKKLDVSKVLEDYYRKPLMDGETTWTLKTGIISYLQYFTSQLLPVEKAIAYEVGCIVGPAEGQVVLTQPQYDVLKKLCDNPEAENAQQRGFPEFSIVVTQQVKKLVDAAETVD